MGKKQKVNSIVLKKVISIAICAILILPVLGQILPTFAQEQNVDDLQRQKDEKKRLLLEIKAKISDLQDQINAQHNKIASLQNELSLYSLQIQQTEQQINALNTEIEFLNLDIIDTLKQIAATEEQVKTKKELLTQLIREIYELDQASPLELILTNNNFSDFLTQVQNTISFQNKNQKLLEELKNSKAELNLKKTALESKKTELEELKIQTEGTQRTLLAQQAQKAALLSYTRGQESRYETLLQEVSEEEAKIQREIFDLDLAIRRQMGDKTLPPVAKKLIWPIEGIITQGYGKTGFTRLGYSFHNGLDIAAPPATPVRAAADGIVYATGTGTTAYGNWIVLKHTLEMEDKSLKNIYTLYAHLGAIKVSRGQAVLQNDLIGLEGNSGNTTRLLYGPERGYHLHFTIFDEEGFGIKDGAYQDIYGPYQIPYGYTYNPLEYLE